MADRKKALAVANERSGQVLKQKVSERVKRNRFKEFQKAIRGKQAAPVGAKIVTGDDQDKRMTMAMLQAIARRRS